MLRGGEGERRPSSKTHGDGSSDAIEPAAMDAHGDEGDAHAVEAECNAATASVKHRASAPGGDAGAGSGSGEASCEGTGAGGSSLDALDEPAANPLAGLELPTLQMSSQSNTSRKSWQQCVGYGTADRIDHWALPGAATGDTVYDLPVWATNTASGPLRRDLQPALAELKPGPALAVGAAKSGGGKPTKAGSASCALTTAPAEAGSGRSDPLVTLGLVASTERGNRAAESAARPSVRKQSVPRTAVGHGLRTLTEAAARLRQSLYTQASPSAAHSILCLR